MTKFVKHNENPFITVNFKDIIYKKDLHESPWGWWCHTTLNARWFLTATESGPAKIIKDKPQRVIASTDKTTK